jgi:hypothetical protein
MSNDEVAQRLGVGPKTVTAPNFKWRSALRECARCVRKPGSGVRCFIYLAEGVERIAEAQAVKPQLPEGFVDVDGACAMFGVTKAAWIIWQRTGRAPRGRWGRSSTNKPCRIFEVDALLRLKEQMRGEGSVYMEGGGSGQYHIPSGWVRMQDACEMFGVHPNTWNRWEAEGLITCGKRFTRRRLKLYPVEQLKRLLDECGRYAPPYPDPDRAGCYRVPLAGVDMHRREAIIDAEDLPLVEGKHCHVSQGEADHMDHVVIANSTLRLHQAVMGVSGNELRVRHMNGDPLDCRRANLVVQSRSEHGAGMRKASAIRGQPCTSRFKGVCWDRRRGKWVAYIKKDQVSRYLGRFSDEIAAAEAYDEAARELFGEHARLNFPDGIDAALAAAPSARAA